MRRYWFLTAALLFLCSASGCLTTYAYPKLDHTPSVVLNAPPTEVHAFRVDVTRSMYLDCPNRWAFGRLTEIPVTSTEEIQAQVKLSVTCGKELLQFDFETPDQTDHAVALRLYRPGYELVEIGSWQHVNRVEWKRAPDLQAQVKVLDRLTSARLAEDGPVLLERPNEWDLF